MNLYVSLDDDGFYCESTDQNKVALQLHTIRGVFTKDEARTIARWLNDVASSDGRIARADQPVRSWSRG